MPEQLLAELVKANAQLQGAAVDQTVKRFAIAVVVWAQQIDERLVVLERALSGSEVGS